MLIVPLSTYGGLHVYRLLSVHIHMKKILSALSRNFVRRQNTTFLFCSIENYKQYKKVDMKILN